jgi:hypothetical protein
MLPLSVFPAYLNNPFLNAPGNEKHHSPAIARPVPMRKLDARRSLDDSGGGRSFARAAGDIDPKNVCVLTSTSLDQLLVRVPDPDQGRTSQSRMTPRRSSGR